MRFRTAVAVTALYVLAAEAGGACFVWWADHRVVYLRPPPAPAASAPDPRAPIAYRQRLHPFFGFTGPYAAAVDRGLYTNSLGFLQREPLSLPVAAPPGGLVVAVFGGSVATNLVITPQHGLPLGEALQELPQAAGRRVVVINMAQGAGKQPQQLIELSYLLALGQHIDVVLVVDGFNEFALGFDNVLVGMSPHLPAGQVMGALANALAPLDMASAAYHEDLARVLEARERTAAAAAACRSARTGLGYAYSSLRHAYFAARARTAEVQLASLDQRGLEWQQRKQAVGIDVAAARDEDAAEQIFSMWLLSSDQMRTLAVAHGAAYVHIIQPNQYYSGRTFSPQERAVAMSLPPSNPYVAGTRAGYRLLEERADLLAAHGVVSGIATLDRLAEPAYVDNCCHYTGAGETALARFVAAEVWRRRSHPPAAPPGG